MIYVGDTVKCLYGIGKVVAYRSDLDSYLVYLGETFNGHDGKEPKYKQDNKHNWWFTAERLEVVKSEPSILDNTEKKYLGAVIKPFIKDVISICKVSSGNGKDYFICIALYKDYIPLPRFNKDSDMYKGMELDRDYTLEELGLAEPKPKCKFKVGEIVKLTDLGAQYDKYDKWFEETKHQYLKKDFIKDCDAKLDRDYIILAVSKHPHLEVNVYAIRDVTGQVYLMGEEGLRLC